MFLEVLAFNDEILLISNSFCNFAIRKQYRFTIAKYTPYIKPKYVTREGTTVLYVRYNYNRTKRTLISTGYSINRNTGILKRDGLSALVQTMMKLMPA